MPSVLLEILASTKEAEKTLKDFQKTATNSLDNISSGFTALKAAAIAAVGFIATDKVVSALKDAAQAAAEQESAINDLNVALASNGRYTNDLSKSLIDYANEVQSATGLDDALVLSQLALAQTYARSADEAKNLVKAAIQLSAVTGKDLNTSVVSLGKTLEGTEGSLGKMLPAVKGLTEAQLKHGDAIGYVLDRFGGVAESKLNTFSGSMTKLKNSFDDVNKAIGKSIVENPALTKIIGEISKVVEKLTDKIKENQGKISDWVTRAIKMAVSALPYMVDAIRAVVYVLGIFSNAFLFIKGSVVAAVNVFNSFGEVMSGVVSIAINGTLAAIYKLDSAFLSLLKMIPGSSKLFESMGINLSDEIDKLDSKIETSLDNIAINFVKTAETVNQDGAFDAIGKSITLVNDLDDALIEVKNSSIGLSKEIENVGSTQKNSSKIAIQALNDQYKAAQMLLDVQAKLTKAGTENPIVNPDQAATFVSTIRFEADSKLPGFIGQVAGAINGALQGAEGAVKLVSGAIGTIADTMLPGIGSTVASIAAVLAKGPDFVRTMVTDFIKSIPQIINNIIDSLPAVFEAIIGVLGSTSFWDKMLQVWIKLAVVWTTAVEASGLAWNAVLTASGIVWEAVLTASGVVWNGVQVVAGAIWQAAVAASAAVWQGATAAFSAIVAGGATIWAYITGAFSTVLQYASTIFSNAAVAGAGIILFVYVFRNELMHLIQEIVRVLSKLGEELGKVGSKLIEEVGNVVRPIMEGLAKFLGEIGQVALKFANEIIGSALRIVEAIIKGISNAIGGALNGLRNAINDFANSIINAGKNLLSAILKGLEDGIKGIFGGIGNLFGGGGGGGGGVGGLLNSVVSGAGSAVKNVLGAVGIRLAKGGVVPEGYQNDTFPSMLSSGEMVIPKTDVDRLSSFLDRQEQRSSQATAQLAQAMSSNQPLTINLTVGEQDLASVILNLNRRGFRTA